MPRNISTLAVFRLRGMTPGMTTLRTRVLVAILAIALPACQTCGGGDAIDGGPADSGPPVLSEKEPNDSAANALVLERSTIVEANLGADPTRPDVDWYVLKASLPRTVDFQATCPNGGDIALEVVDETGSVLAQVNTGGAGAPERMPNVDVSSKTLIVSCQLITTRKIRNEDTFALKIGLEKWKTHPLCPVRLLHAQIYIVLIKVWVK